MQSLWSQQDPAYESALNVLYVACCFIYVIFFFIGPSPNNVGPTQSSLAWWSVKAWHCVSSLQLYVVGMREMELSTEEDLLLYTECPRLVNQKD